MTRASLAISRIAIWTTASTVLSKKSAGNARNAKRWLQPSAAQRERHPLPLAEAAARLAAIIDAFFPAALAWAKAGGQPLLVAIMAEAGIGKTELVLRWPALARRCVNSMSWWLCPGPLSLRSSSSSVCAPC